jgi:hypothetical protein
LSLGLPVYAVFDPISRMVYPLVFVMLDVVPHLIVIGLVFADL